MWAYQALMITEARRCGGRGWLYNADFSRLNQALYATIFLAYGNRKQSCPNCMLPDHTGPECALHSSKPSSVTGVPTGMHTTNQEKHSRYFDEKPTRGELRRNVLKEAPAMHGMMGCAQRSIASGSMCALNVREITGRPCAIWAL